MVILGGYDCSNSSLLTQTTKSLFSLNKAVIYDSKLNRWYEKTLNGEIPHARTFHTAVKCKYGFNHAVCYVAFTKRFVYSKKQLHYHLWR